MLMGIGRAASLAASLLLATLAGAAAATEGSLYLSFDATSLQTEGNVRVAEPFSFYLVAELPAGSPGLFGFECGLEVSPEILLTGMTFADILPGALNIAPGWSGDGRFDIVAGTGGCSDASLYPNAIIEFEGIVLQEAQDLLVSVGPSRWPSWSTATHAQWVDCDNQVIRQFGVPEFGAGLALSTAAVATDISSFGRVRALYAKGGSR